jgi:hypothetical protein
MAFSSLRRGVDHPGPGDHIAAAQGIAVEEGKHEDREPHQPGPARFLAVGAAGPGRGEEHQRHEQLDIAHQVARDHRFRGQPPAIARGDAQAADALARRGPARPEFEEQEIGVAIEEHRDDPRDRQRLPGMGNRVFWSRRSPPKPPATHTSSSVVPTIEPTMNNRSSSSAEARAARDPIAKGSATPSGVTTRRRRLSARPGTRRPAPVCGFPLPRQTRHHWPSAVTRPRRQTKK